LRSILFIIHYVLSSLNWRWIRLEAQSISRQTNKKRRSWPPSSYIFKKKGVLTSGARFRKGVLGRENNILSFREASSLIKHAGEFCEEVRKSIWVLRLRETEKRPPTPSFRVVKQNAADSRFTRANANGWVLRQQN